MSTPNLEDEAQIEPENSDEEGSGPESEPEPEPTESDDEEEDSDSDSNSDAESDDEPLAYAGPDGTTRQLKPYGSGYENTPENNIRRFNKVLDSKRYRRQLEEDDERLETLEDLYNFPPDPENWQEEDLKELWADGPIWSSKTGWDPHNVDAGEVEALRREIKDGRDPPIAPFYVPYRQPYPVIPTNHHDIRDPKAVIEELDRIEEFLRWVSFIFEDGSSYEGTVWDDGAHGKGVYVAEKGLVRYEGEWLQNNMAGHGVIEVEIPHPEPIPGSKLEEKMRAEGRIISRDFMSPEDREWLEMDIEDSLKVADGEYEIPFYENKEWIRQFGRLPEKGRYRYAGQWKHGRMHGCGVYEVNERTTFGRFYFGELLNEDTYGCEAEISAMHAGIAEVAAAKARMFVNKPDGMIREDRGPYSDPQHPYLYEEDDVWMAPGFINQFYEVPDYWKMYVHEVDQEREMWLNSFYRAPLRLPMPSELEYWWAQDQKQEFVLINKEPEPDPEDPSKLVYSEDPLILHTPTGRIINYVDDEENGIRLFWQPALKDGEDPNPDEVEFLPLGFDEFYGREVDDEKDKSGVDESKRHREREAKRAELEAKANEKMEKFNKEKELIETEWALEDSMEELDGALQVLQKEEEEKVEQGIEEEDVSVSEKADQTEPTPAEAQEEDEDEEDDDVAASSFGFIDAENSAKDDQKKGNNEKSKFADQTEPAPAEAQEEDEEDEDEEGDDVAASSFGSIDAENSTKDDQKGNNGKSKFASASLSFASSNLISLVPQKLQNQFVSWKERNFEKQVASLPTPTRPFYELGFETKSPDTVRFPLVGKSLKLRCERKQTHYVQQMRKSRKLSKTKACMESIQGWEDLGILSLHTPITM